VSIARGRGEPVSGSVQRKASNDTLSHSSDPGGEGSEEEEEEEEEEEDNDEIPYMPSDSSSRLQQEFKCFKRIGKGAYGDVIKVINNKLS